MWTIHNHWVDLHLQVLSSVLLVHATKHWHWRWRFRGLSVFCILANVCVLSGTLAVATYNGVVTAQIVLVKVSLSIIRG